MSRPLTAATSLDNLKKEAKRWLKALRANDEEARARLRRAWPGAPAKPGLRDVQRALALEHGLAGWTPLKDALANRDLNAMSPEAALTALLDAANRGDLARVTELLDRYPDIVSERGLLPGHTVEAGSMVAGAVAHAARLGRRQQQSRSRACPDPVGRRSHGACSRRSHAP